MDDGPDDIVSTADTPEVIATNDAPEVTSSDYAQEAVGSEDDTGNFTELSDYISNEIASGNYNIELNKNYKFADGEEISIDIGNRNHDININGNNHFIDGSNQVRIFRIVNYNHVLLENIIFKNANSANGAIYSLSEHLTIKNCTFENNTGNRGGAMYINANTQIINCTFENNSASLYGGAIFVNGENTKIIDSTFKNNSAHSYGGAIQIEAQHCTISGSEFENNKAIAGGAIISDKEYAVIENCIFNNNYAGVNRWLCGGAVVLRTSSNSIIKNSKFNNNTGNSSGGAISIYYSQNITIDTSSFDGNKAHHDGGAVVLFHSQNINFKNTNFTKNEVTDTATINPGSYGSAIRGADSTANINIYNCTFDSNIAHNNAGAIEYYGTNLTIIDSRFSNNIAHSDGGAIYCHSDGFVNLTGCNFTSNIVLKGYGYDTSTKVTGVSGPYTSGAVLLRKNPTKTSLNSYIANCRFEDNVAPYIAGALCIRTETPNSHHAIVTDSYFNGNNASFGSAIYLYELATMDISNTIFGKNRANSSTIEITVDKKISYYPSDVNITVTLQGWDNIANAIWNGGNATSFFVKQQIVEDFSSVRPGNVNHIRLCNITYEVYHNGELKTVTAYRDGLQNPVSGYSKADVGNNIWQDTLEDAQSITLRIYKINDDNSNASESGVLSAGDNNLLTDETGSLIAEVTAPLTEISGAMSNIQKSLKPGNYVVKASHARDVYYTEIETESDFQILSLKTKISVGNVTTYPDTDVTIPINVTTEDGSPFNGNVTITFPDGTNKTVEITNGSGSTTWHVPEDYTPDKYGDTVKFPGNDKYAPSNGTGTITVIKIPTHVSVGNITTFPGRDVTIPINVTADDGIPFNGKVTIQLPDGSTQTVEIVNGRGSTTWHVPSDYTPDKYKDTVKFIGNNKYLPSSGIGTITVIKIPVDITVGNITAKPGDDVTIPIKVVPRDGSVFNGNVTVELPDGTKKVIEIINGKGSVDWTIPDDYDGDYTVKVSFDGSDVYYPANGTGIITVIPDKADPVDDENGNPVKQYDIETDSKTTGNPILVLLAVLAVLGINIKRRK